MIIIQPRRHKLCGGNSVATYEYKCDADNQEASIQRPMAEAEVIPVCTICNMDMKRVYYAAPVKFNGTGFYSTGG